MITQIKFENFKALKNAQLKLGAFNVIVGPNGSGKSSVLQGIEILAEPHRIDYGKSITATASPNAIKIIATFRGSEFGGIHIDSTNKRVFVMADESAPALVAESVYWETLDRQSKGFSFDQARQVALTQFKVSMKAGNSINPSAAPNTKSKLSERFRNFKVFSFEATALGQPVGSGQITELNREGRNLAGALTHLRDKDEDAYNRLRVEFQKWIPEYDGVGFDTDQHGSRTITLRQKHTRHTVSASQASEGTLLALALLTIVYQPTPPSLIGLEEPDRGLHPRLLRELRDALYRLSFPSEFGINRLPVQVVVTTHSPFFLDLFRDHPEQVIIAEKQKDGTAAFKNLSEDKELQELIGDAPLGEVWYSGVLGGVPVPA